MKVWVMSLEHPEEDFRESVYSLRYDCSDKQFSMPCPMGDDWLQEIRHRPAPLPALVKVDGLRGITDLVKQRCRNCRTASQIPIK